MSSNIHPASFCVEKNQGSVMMTMVKSKSLRQKKVTGIPGVSKSQVKVSTSMFWLQNLFFVSLHKPEWDGIKERENLLFGNLPFSFLCVYYTAGLSRFPLKVERLSALPSNVFAAFTSYRPGQDPWLLGLAWSRQCAWKTSQPLTLLFPIREK